MAKCGEKTEVYSRVCGYFRPVSNWNKGKKEEFKDRKTYDIGRSHLTHVRNMAAEAMIQSAGTPVVTGSAQTLLFVGATCPNCRLAVQMLDKAGMDYETVMSQDNMELCRKFGVMATPTLVITDGEHTEKYAGAGAIKSYLKSEQAV